MRWASIAEQKSINDNNNDEFINFNFSMELAELCAELESILSIKESLITKMQSIMT